MPEEGIDYVPRQALMTYEEMERMIWILAKMGIQKIRITGGEPFLRKDLIYFLQQIAAINGIQKINITTNGTLTQRYLEDLKRLNISGINLSLDTLDKERFYKITRRDVFDDVMETYFALIAHQHFNTKINAVVMDNQNIEDIIPMVELTKNHPVGVRFIEEMPFNGSGAHYQDLKWNYKAILAHIQSQFPDIQKIPDPPNSTALNYKVKGFKGTIGIIPAYSRTFCGTCNRIRMTPQGTLKTCLYDDGVFNIRDIIRSGATDEQIKATFLEALGNRAKNGFVAEQRRFQNSPVTESMATIGG
jgi:cyclic pyranopterin phosphate synthase